MSSMYKGTKKFDREQLIFVTNVILSSALDRIESLFPPATIPDEYENLGDCVTAWTDATIQVAGQGLAVFYAQLTQRLLKPH